MAWDALANITPELMAKLQAAYQKGQAGGSGYNNASYTDPTTGAQYSPNINRVQNSGAEGDFTDQGVNGITATDGRPWYAGQRGYVYDPQGGFTGDFAVEDPNKRDWGELIAKGMIGAIAGGAALSGLGGGYGASGLTEPVSSIGSGTLPGGAGMDIAGFEGLADAGVSGTTGAGGNALANTTGLQTMAPVSTVTLPSSGAELLTTMSPTGATGLLSSVAPYIGPAASVIGGVVAGNAAKDAAETQAQSAREAQDIQERMFNKVVELNEPFRQGGLNALERLQIGIGLKDGEGKGDLTRDFTAADFQADPGYQYRLDEGQKALDRFAASRGRFNAGRTAKDTMRFQQGEASQEYGRAFDRFGSNQAKKLNPLQSLTGVAQSSANTVGGAAQNYGNNAANLITGAGNATAAGQVGRMNAITGGVSQGISQYQTNALLDRLLERGRY